MPAMKNEKHELYVQTAIRLRHRTKAYMEVYGVSEHRAGIGAATLGARPDIMARFVELKTAIADQFVISESMILEQWWMIATADPNELVQYRRVCCRWCHGREHEFQWINEREWARDMARAMDDAARTGLALQAPSEVGGFGFNATLPPHGECPECFGEGVGTAHFLDTRNLSPAAKLLYGGVKVTARGTEIIIANQSEARVNIARFLGMFHDRMPGDANGNPLPPMIGYEAKSIEDAQNAYKKMTGVK